MPCRAFAGLQDGRYTFLVYASTQAGVTGAPQGANFTVITAGPAFSSIILSAMCAGLPPQPFFGQHLEALLAIIQVWGFPDFYEAPTN